MPVAEDQTLFPMEYCGCCNKPGVLILNWNDTYRWRCHKGGRSWVTEGSKLDVYNELARKPADDDFDTDF